MIQKFRRFMVGRRGQGMSEYIIMVGLVAIAAIGIYTIFGNQIREAVATIGLQLAGQTGAEQDDALQAEYAGQNGGGKEVNLGAFGNGGSTSTNGQPNNPTPANP